MPPFSSETPHGHLHRHRRSGGRMDRLFRVVSACLLGLLLALVYSHARAAPPVHKWFFSPFTGWFDSPEQACESRLDSMSSGHVYVGAVPDANTASGTYYCQSRHPQQTYDTTFATAQRTTRCADNTTPDTSRPLNEQCSDPPPPTCEHGEPVWNASTYTWSCPAPPACPSLGEDMGVGTAQHSSAGYTGGLVCINGCSAYPRTAGQSQDGTWYAWGPYTSVGVPCQGGTSGGSEPPDIQEPPQRCPAGQCPGTVNGALICAPCFGGQDRPPPTSSDTTVTNPDGSTTTTTTSTQSHTNCEGASCTTTTTTTTTRTTTPAGGGTPTTETTTETRTETEPRDDYCTENPRSAQCVESSFGGSCSSQFRCEGDAVQCAIAQEQHRRNCALFEDETTLSRLGEAAANGQAMPEGHPGLDVDESPIDLASRINTAPAFGGSGGCPSNVTVAGYNLPFSQVCQYLDLVRPAVIGFAWLVAAFVVFRRR